MGSCGWMPELWTSSQSASVPLKPPALHTSVFQTAACSPSKKQTNWYTSETKGEKTSAPSTSLCKLQNASQSAHIKPKWRQARLSVRDINDFKSAGCDEEHWREPKLRVASDEEEGRRKKKVPATAQRCSIALPQMWGSSWWSTPGLESGGGEQTFGRLARDIQTFLLGIPIIPLCAEM